MDNTQRVRAADRLAGLAEEGEAGGEREVARGAVEGARVLDELHRDPVDARAVDLVVAARVDGRDRRVADAREDRGLVGARAVHDLDRDLAVGRGLARAPDGAHAARRERRDEFECAEPRAWREIGRAQRLAEAEAREDARGRVERAGEARIEEGFEERRERAVAKADRG